MADIFIAYSRVDQSIASLLFKELSLFWSVWWDDHSVRSFDEEIQQELAVAGVVVAILSASSIESTNVTDELFEARKLGKTILFASLEDIDAPFGFRRMPKIDFRDWNSGNESEGWLKLKRKIGMVVDISRPPKRPALTDEEVLKFPAIFNSTSSFETKLKTSEAFEVLVQFGAGQAGSKLTQSVPTALVSAYDLLEDNCETEDDLTSLSELKDLIVTYRKMGGFVLIDSGNYEAARLGDKSWSREKFGRALNDVEHDWVFSFDYGEENETGDRNPITDKQEILAGLSKDQQFTGHPIIPILHAPEQLGGGHDLSDLPEIAMEIAKSTNPPMIAIPERELGPGLLESTKTVMRIREALNQLPNYQRIHILGTGSPWSIAIYSAAGADSFDGLEWCRMVIDRTSGQWFHNQHFCLLSHQKSDAISEVTSFAFSEESGVEYGGHIAFHNLDFLSEFACDLRKYANKNELRAFVNVWLRDKTLTNLNTELPDLFK